MDPKFVVDVNVGRLAKWLRVMGYDALFIPGAEDAELIRLAMGQGRIILTRDSLLMQRRIVTSGRARALLITSDDIRTQLRQVVEGLGLNSCRDFSRCIECNVVLKDTEKASVRDQVPPYVFQTQTEFMRCAGCGKIYWRGTHWRNMRLELASIRGASR